MKLSEAVTSLKFNETMDMIREKSSAAHYVRSIKLVQITGQNCISYIAGWRRYGVNTSNHCESWNRLIVEYRTQPIHVLLDKIRTVCMERYKRLGDAARRLKGKLAQKTE